MGTTGSLRLPVGLVWTGDPDLRLLAGARTPSKEMACVRLLPMGNESSVPKETGKNPGDNVT